MKNTLKKRTFISAIAMLVVSAIVLTSSTFAWFSMATRVEVETMELNITSPDGVQLSGNANAFTTMLTLADLKGETTARWAAYEGNQNNFPELLVPSSSDLHCSNSLPVFFSGSISDTGLLTATRVASDLASGYVAFDVFVKVAQDQPIYWNETKITCDDNPEVVSAMRVGVVNCGVVQPKAEANAILAVKPVSHLGNVCAMYQPAHKIHTAASGYEDGADVPDLYLYNNYVNREPEGNGNNIGTNINLVRKTESTAVNDENKATAAFFNAKAGINRIRVYLWMEGNDVDCENSVAGATIDFNLAFKMA